MAVGPAIIKGEVLSYIDLAYIELWEQWIDHQLVLLRDWPRKKAFMELCGESFSSDDEPGDEVLIPVESLGEWLVGLSGIKTEYGGGRKNETFLWVQPYIELKGKSRVEWNDRYFAEIERRYKEQGWADVKGVVRGLPEGEETETYVAVHRFLVFSPPPPPELPEQSGAGHKYETARRSCKTGSGRSGWVYLLEAENGLYKIGRSRRPAIRISQITKAVAPFEIRQIHKAFYPDCVTTEAELHKRFESKRRRGEWFALTPADVKSVIEHQYEAK